MLDARPFYMNNNFIHPFNYKFASASNCRKVNCKHSATILSCIKCNGNNLSYTLMSHSNCFSFNCFISHYLYVGLIPFPTCNLIKVRRIKLKRHFLLIDVNTMQIKQQRCTYNCQYDIYKWRKGDSCKYFRKTC